MSEFLRNFQNALSNKIYIEQPVLNHIGKVGDFLLFDSTVLDGSTIKQFVCSPPDLVRSDGPAIQLVEFDNDKEFTIIHIQKLEKLITEWTKKIRFINLLLPGSGVEIAQTHRHNNIVGRYIEAYYPITDTIAKRWDFLIQKLD